MLLLLATFSTTIPLVEFRNAGLIAVAFLALLAIAETWHRMGNPPVEWTRKLVHFGGGATCLLLPILIKSAWLALVLAIGMCILFGITKTRGWLRSVHGVSRSSSGTEFYPVVIFLLFLLTASSYWQFVICVLVLAVSDSAAALIGTRFGKLKFRVEEETKSLEGSIAFFIVTFLVVAIPLWIWDPLASSGNSEISANFENRHIHYLLSACLLGLLITCVEVVSLRGTDNLWVPLGSWLVLAKTAQTDASDLLAQNGSFCVMLGCLLLIARTSKLLNVGGALVCCLTAYGMWAMGSLDWAIVFFVAFAIYFATAWKVQAPWEIRVRVSVYSLAPSFACLAIANLLLNHDNPEGYRQWFGPFLAASCVSLGQATSNLACWSQRRNPGKRLAIAASISILVSLSVLSATMARQGIADWTALGVIVIVACGLVVLSTQVLPTLPPGDAPKSWLRIRAINCCIAALLVFLIQFAGICNGWHPA